MEQNQKATWCWPYLCQWITFSLIKAMDQLAASVLKSSTLVIVMMDIVQPMLTKWCDPRRRVQEKLRDYRQCWPTVCEGIKHSDLNWSILWITQESARPVATRTEKIGHKQRLSCQHLMRDWQLDRTITPPESPSSPGANLQSRTPFQFLLLCLSRGLWQSDRHFQEWTWVARCCTGPWVESVVQQHH